MQKFCVGLELRESMQYVMRSRLNNTATKQYRFGLPRIGRTPPYSVPRRWSGAAFSGPPAANFWYTLPLMSFFGPFVFAGITALPRLLPPLCASSRRRPPRNHGAPARTGCWMPPAAARCSATWACCRASCRCGSCAGPTVWDACDRKLSPRPQNVALETRIARFDRANQIADRAI